MKQLYTQWPCVQVSLMWLCIQQCCVVLQTQVMLQRFKACVLCNTVALELHAEAWKFGMHVAVNWTNAMWSCLATILHITEQIV